MPLREFDDEQLDHLARAVAKALSDTRAPRSNWDRRLTGLLGVMTIVSLVFTFGVNWSRIAENERRIDANVRRIDRHDTDIQTLRQELNMQGSSIQQQLGEIKQQLGEIKGSLLLRK